MHAMYTKLDIYVFIVYIYIYVRQVNFAHKSNK